MILSFRRTRQSLHTPGIFISKCKIVNAEDISRVLLPRLNNVLDIGIKLTLDVGKNFQPELIIAGNFKRDLDTGEVSGWGSAFVVQEALTRLGYEGPLTEKNGIPEKVLDELAGKTILRLSYVSGTRADGKLRYCDWNQIGTPETGEGELEARFKRSLTRGYPKNFKPQDVTGPEKEVVPVLDEDPF